MWDRPYKVYQWKVNFYNPRMGDLELALTFDDVLLVPSFSDVLPRDVSLTTQFSRNISFQVKMEKMGHL